MKKVVSIFLILITFQSYGQIIIINPITWNYSAKRIGIKMYEVYLTAAIQNPWHIYSQSTPEGGPIPTKIGFKKNPLVTHIGKAKEKGKLLKKREEVFDVDVKYYNERVDFIQVIKMKNNSKNYKWHNRIYGLQ